MIVCDTYAQATQVPGLVHVVSGDKFYAYQQGDALPAVAVADNSVATAREAAVDASIATTTFGAVQPATIAELKGMTVAQYG